MRKWGESLNLVRVLPGPTLGLAVKVEGGAAAVVRVRRVERERRDGERWW